MSIGYKPHVDGLRCLAITPVVLYHAGVPYLTGGYVGVDVFFVISGYLITSIVTGELAAGRSSILSFYRRRVLRIVPLLTIVLAATAVAAQFVLFPRELGGFGGSMVAASLFASNIYFWQDTGGYFDAFSGARPLLHTWSLAVEEQFYIVFPPLLMALHRWARWLVLPVLTVLVALSVAASGVGVELAPNATFYLLPTRAWELGAGALLALAPPIVTRSGTVRELLAVAGLVFVVAPVFYLTEISPFPGLNAVPPVLGAVLLILVGGEARSTALLRWPPVVFVGLISYALYLWHWPVIIFDKLVTGPDMAGVDMLRVIAISVGLAVASRPLIEMPFRRLRGAFPSRIVLAGGLLALVAMAGIGLVLAQTDWLQRSFPRPVLAMASFADYPQTAEYRDSFRAGTCFMDNGVPATDIDLGQCLASKPGARNVLLFGDSHAAQLSGGIRAMYPEINLLQVTAAGCRPFLRPSRDPSCTKLMQRLLVEELPRLEVDGVIIAGRWQPDEVADIAAVADHLRQLDKRVMVTGPTVEYEGPVPAMLARAAIWNNGNDPLVDARSKVPDRADRLLATALRDRDVTYRSLIDIICPAMGCRSVVGSVPMQFDYGHLTLAGSKVVAEGLRLGDWLE